jgi:death-on-curing protein
MTEIVWLDLPEALAIHARQLDEHGGASGLRDLELLESALARPRQRHAYGDPDVFYLAAAYTAAIIGNHPFVDGNKRTGFVVGVLFLELNGPTLTASEADATQAVLDLAAGEIKEDEFASWLRANSTSL